MYINKSKFMKLIEKFLNEVATECKKEHNKKKIEIQIIDPFLDYIIKRLQPYFIATTVIILVLLVSISVIIWILVTK